MAGNVNMDKWEKIEGESSRVIRNNSGDASSSPTTSKVTQSAFCVSKAKAPVTSITARKSGRGELPEGGRA